MADSTTTSLPAWFETYWADRFWRLVARPPGRCWPWLGRKARGYGVFHIFGDGLWRAHRIVYALTHGAIPAGLNVLHTCDNPSCCNPDHLYAGTQLRNVADMVERERQARGEGNARHKLYEDEVLEIRALYAAGGVTYEQLGRRYGVSDSQIARIVKGQRWRYLVSGEAA